MEEDNITAVSALVVYADQDRGFRSRFEPYLTLLEREHYLDEFTFLNLTDLKRTEEDGVPHKADIFLFVVTTSLIVHPFFGGEAFKKIKALHHMRQRLVIPMLNRQTPLHDKVFSRISAIPTNQKPVMDDHWSSPDEAINELYSSLKTICFEYRKAKDQLERAWQTAKRQNNAGAFQYFLTRHPHSQYQTEALEAVKKHTEDQLWKKAQREDSVDGYYDYLTNSPIKKHRFEAANHIARLQQDPARNWQEIQKKDHLVLYLDYYLRNPDGKQAKEVKKIIDERLANPINSTKGLDFKTQKNSLEMKAYEKLTPAEIFSMNTFARSSNHIKMRLTRLIQQRQSNQLFHAGILLALGLLEIWLFTRWYQPSIDQYGFFDMPTTRLFQGVFMIVFNIWFLMRAYFYFEHMRRDVSFLKRAYYVMQSLSVLLKVSILARDNDSTETMLKFFNRIDRRTAEIERKTILDYLTQADDQNQESLVPAEKLVT